MTARSQTHILDQEEEANTENGGTERQKKVCISHCLVNYSINGTADSRLLHTGKSSSSLGYSHF